MMPLSSTKLLMFKRDEFVTAALNIKKALFFVFLFFIFLSETHFNKAAMKVNISAFHKKKTLTDTRNSHHHHMYLFFCTQMEASS